MTRKIKFSIVLALFFCTTVLSVLVFHSTGDSTPKAIAAPDEIYDICLMLNTDIATGEIDGDGWYDCVCEYEGLN